MSATIPASVRFADAADVPELARMRWEFRSAMNPPAEPELAFIERCATWMVERLSGGQPWQCWVAERHGGRLAGHLWLQLIEKIPNPAHEREHHAYITNVFVRPGDRSGGIGARLVEAALAWCREKGVDSVVLWPTQRSRSLYARHGFESPLDIMEAVIHPGRDLGVHE